LRRTHHDVKAGILKSCSFGSVSVSQLLASQNLSYKILKPILDHLVSAKLVEFEIDGRRKLVRTTDLGLTAFRAYKNALALLEGYKTSLTINESISLLRTGRKDRGTLS
jgi:predicted transcriptional regulator